MASDLPTHPGGIRRPDVDGPLRVVAEHFELRRRVREVVHAAVLNNEPNGPSVVDAATDAVMALLTAESREAS